MKKTLKEIAALVDGNILGEENVTITGVGGIESATAEQITFAVDPHLSDGESCGAGAVIVPLAVESYAKPAIRVENPRSAFTKLLELFTPTLHIPAGVHPAAIVGERVTIGKNAAIMAYAVVADDAVIGDNAILYPHTYIGHGVEIGDDSIVYPNVTVREHCKIGKRVILHANAAIGSDGFGFVTENGCHTKVPQVGNVVIEDDVEVGSHVGIDRATTGSTIVKRGTKIDNLVHIAHNVIVGENCLFVAQTGIAGSTTIGESVTFAGQCGCQGHVHIGSHTVFAARSGPISDVPEGSFYGGFPARPHREWLRTEAVIKRLPDMAKTVKELERRLERLEKEKK